MNYLAILGRQPELGLTELECQLGPDAVEPFGQTAPLDQTIDINRFGGIQKLGKIIYRGPLDLENLPTGQLPLRESKTSFGVSLYGKFSARDAYDTGLALKKKLREYGSVRFVQPAEGSVLSAAQLKFNQIPEKGFDLIIAQHRQEMIVALTASFQDIDWYAKRDYDRPARSAKVGMLPPKLAQIMINTTNASNVYDPFCGTGVVLQEALLLGRKAGGSDISAEMVAASKQNIDWLQDQSTQALPDCDIKKADATSIQLPNEPLAIVSEGYLGPNQTTQPDEQTYHSLKKELGELYYRALQNWSKQLPAGADVTITLPYWKTKEGWRGLDILDRLSDLGYTLRVLKHVDTRKLVYRRPDQIVGRQLLLLRKS